MHLASGNIPVSRDVLPEGERGVDETVRRMVRMAHGQYGARSPKVRALAINILNRGRVADKDYYGMIVAIHNYVRDQVRYILDTVGQETLSHPEETLFNSKAGDCDDKVIAEIALLGAIGIKAWPVVAGRAPGEYSHVYLYAQVPPGSHRQAGKVVPLDPIMREWAAGREPPLAARKQYRQFAEGPTMNGLGAYASGPDYLPRNITAEEVSRMAGKPMTATKEVVSPEATNGGVVQTTSQVTVRSNGVDRSFDHVGTPEQVADMLGPGYDRYGRRLRNQPPQPQSINSAVVAPDGPVYRNTAKMLPQAPAAPLAQQRKERALARIRNANPVVSVPNDHMRPKTQTNGRAKPDGSVPAQEVERLDGLRGLMEADAASIELAGLGGLGNIGKGFEDEVLENTAVMSWWADWKARLMDAVASHAAEVRGKLEAAYRQGNATPYRLRKAQSLEAAARDLAEAAKAVQQQARDLEQVAAGGNGARAAVMADVKQQLTAAEAETGLPTQIDSLPPKVAITKARSLPEEPSYEAQDGTMPVRSYGRPFRARRRNMRTAAAAAQAVDRARNDYLQLIAEARDQDALQKTAEERNASLEGAAAKRSLLRQIAKSRRRRSRALIARHNAAGIRSARAQRQAMNGAPEIAPIDPSAGEDIAVSAPTEAPAIDPTASTPDVTAAPAAPSAPVEVEQQAPAVSNTAKLLLGAGLLALLMR